LAKRPAVGPQLDTLPRMGDLFQASFNLRQQDQLSTGLGTDFIHFRAMPSPIGKKDRGDYRRSETLDTISSNGMLYKRAGCFTATMTDNSTKKSRGDSGMADPSQSRLVMPRFYNKDGSGSANGERIYLAPGDRLYIADKDADVNVSTYQEVQHQPDRHDVLAFPATKVEHLEDSRGVEYKCGRDFELTSAGDISWKEGGNSPGIDPDTGEGRVFSIRYLYKAYWYVLTLPKEIRVTNVTTSGVRAPERMPYHAVVVREYVYHNQQRGGKDSQRENETSRTREAPKFEATPAKLKGQIKVDMTAMDDEPSES